MSDALTPGTADELYQYLTERISRLSPAKRAEFRARVLTAELEDAKAELREQTADAKAAVLALIHLKGKMLDSQWSRRTDDRDDEIIRLHDEDRATFGQMGSRLKVLNPAWAAKNGRPISAKAAEKAYHRRKEALQDPLEAKRQILRKLLHREPSGAEVVAKFLDDILPDGDN